MIDDKPSDVRLAAGFMLGPAAGAVCLGLVLGSFSGFTANTLKMVLGALLFGVYPATLFLAVPTYFAIRKIRRLQLGWTSAFGAATAPLPLALMGLIVRFPEGDVPSSAMPYVFGFLCVLAAVCGGVGGAVFWLVVVRRGARSSFGT